MNSARSHRGAAPVGHISELPGLEAASVIYFRLWCEGPERQQEVWSDFHACLGETQANEVSHSFHELCSLCCLHGRRPLMRHSIGCKCLGADESCFANFVAAAAEGDREDALLMATLIVRPDMAPMITSLATQVGLAMKRMQLRAPVKKVERVPEHVTIH